MQQSAHAVFSVIFAVFSQNGLALLARIMVDWCSESGPARPRNTMARAAAVTARGPGPRGVSHVSTSTVAPPRAARPAPPPARHGTCRWSVYIATDGRTGGKHYSV